MLATAKSLSYSKNMISSKELSVPYLVTEIGNIEKETEEIYLRLGQVFQSIKKAVDTSAYETEESVKRVLAEHRSGLNPEVARKRFDNFIQDSTKFFSKAAESETVFVNGVEAGLESLSHLDFVINKIRSDSEEMEIVSLNAMTAALKSGSAGRAFSVITDELKKLSGKTIRHADKLAEVGTDLTNKLEKLKASLDQLQNAQSEFFAFTKDALENGFKSLDADVTNTANAIRALGTDAESVRNPVSEIVQEVQLQDIIRQSLDHVLLSLQASKTEENNNNSSDPEEERAFLTEITKLSASLLKDISSKIRASYQRFVDGIQGVNNVMLEVENNRKKIISSRSDALDGSDFEQKASNYLTAKQMAINEAADISDGVKRLDGRFREMNSILSRFKSIVTASRIETARNRALTIVATTVAGMMDLTERLAEDVDATGELTNGFTRTMNAGMIEYLSESDEKISDFRKEIDSLRKEFTHISSSKRSLNQTEDDFRPFSSSFESSVSEASIAVQRIAQLADEIDSMQAQLSNYSSQNENSIKEANAIHSQVLRNIVERFTIFAHKQTAKQIANIDIDDSNAESGDVTLF